MKLSKLLLLLLVIPLFAFSGLHKYYISVTQINYAKEQQAVQIISRIFIDDFENVLRSAYDEKITLAGEDEPQIANQYIEDYLKQKLNIKINNKSVTITYIGKEYDGDIMRCYMEIEHVKNIKTITINNNILFDLYEQQQNIVKTKINAQHKSEILSFKNEKMTLNFN